MFANNALRVGDLNCGFDWNPAIGGVMYLGSTHYEAYNMSVQSWYVSIASTIVLQLWNNGQLWSMGPMIPNCDENSKFDIVDEERGIEVLRNIHPKRYRRRQGDHHVEVGFSAQDAKAAMAESVHEFTDPEGVRRMGFDNNAIIAALVNTVNRLWEKVNG